MPGADSLMEAGPVAGSSPLQSIREDTVRAGITALKADETATVLEREAETVSREVSEKLDDVQRLLRDQQQLERERWEELVKRQREDLIRLKTQDLELANEVDFLRARLDRVSAERDRAIHAAQSAREKDLERQLAERTAEVQKQATRIQSLQDAVQRLETQVEMRTTRAIRELEAKHAQEKKQLADEWTVRLTEIKNTNAGRIEALQEDLARAREEVTAVRKEMEENKVLDADYKSRIQALQGSIDKLSDENSRLKERLASSLLPN